MLNSYEISTRTHRPHSGSAYPASASTQKSAERTYVVSQQEQGFYLQQDLPPCTVEAFQARSLAGWLDGKAAGQQGSASVFHLRGTRAHARPGACTPRQIVGFYLEFRVDRAIFNFDSGKRPSGLGPRYSCRADHGKKVFVVPHSEQGRGGWFQLRHTGSQEAKGTRVVVPTHGHVARHTSHVTPTPRACRRGRPRRRRRHPGTGRPARPSTSPRATTCCTR